MLQSCLHRVHCRIGSLEIIPNNLTDPNGVHCRIGSLEKMQNGSDYCVIVHCRIGSLEKNLSRAFMNSKQMMAIDEVMANIRTRMKNIQINLSRR